MRKIILIMLCLISLGYCFGQNNFRNFSTKKTHKKEKLALIIANNNYEFGGKLAMPVPTAQKLEQSFTAMGIDVVAGYNLDRTNFLTIMDEFRMKFKQYKTGIVVFLGHGFQIDGENYLIPIDANPPNKHQVKYHAIDLDDVLAIVRDPNKPKLIILDACRNNPFEENWISDERSGLKNGFDVSDGTIAINSKVLFSTQKNTKVRDDNPYMQYFVEEISKGGCISEINRNVAKRVYQFNKSQITDTKGQLFDDICFGFYNKNENSKDRDNDGYADEVDACPDEFSKTNKGCPEQDYKGIPTVLVTGGAFEMGCVNGDATCAKDETPIRRITINDFRMSKYETTVGQFKRFVIETGYLTDAEKSGGSFVFDGEWKLVKGVNWRFNAAGKVRPVSEYNHPVMHVSWNDAKAFAKWAGGRLPTEAEWEYAAKGGAKSKGYIFSGSNDLNEVAWFNGNTQKMGAQTVGTKQANELGLFDMSGNVWEWCEDWYTTYDKLTDMTLNPKGPEKGLGRVLRGGSWDYDASYSRSSYRGYVGPNRMSSYNGFRICF